MKIATTVAAIGRVLTSVLLGAFFVQSQVNAGAYVTAGAAQPDRIVHPSNYTGTGGTLTVTLCVAPGSDGIGSLDVLMQNIVNTWNTLEPTTGNVILGGGNNIPSGEVDVESTALHELGHCIGLAHPNLASESGLGEPDRNYTKALQGPNNNYDLGIGGDGVRGSPDDQRGDDINLHWFSIDDNNPFTVGSVVTPATYSIDLGDLPAGDSFAANADINVSNLFGVPNSEAAMQQGARTDEDQRQLTADDVATIRLGIAGLDETQGTADDYNLNLVYGGVANGCDVTFQMTGNSFAFCSLSTAQIQGRHYRMNSASITLGSTAAFNWFFNQTPNVDLIFEDSLEAIPLR